MYEMLVFARTKSFKFYELETVALLQTHTDTQIFYIDC